MKNRFTIGEMARLHNIPVKTLRFYDEIGIFRPAEVKTSGYRYYSIDQFEHLNTILYLKFLGFSLKEIQQHLETRDIEHFMALLRKQQQITEATIHRLKTVSRQFANRLAEIDQITGGVTVMQPAIKHIPVRYVLKVSEPVYSESEWEMALRRLGNQTGGNPALFIGKVGLTIAQENLLQGKFDEYNSVFVLWEEPVSEHLAVEGFVESDYACIYYRGSHNNSAQPYQYLLSFIEAGPYRVSGDAIERMIIDPYITSDSRMHLTELQVPVKLRWSTTA